VFFLGILSVDALGAVFLDYLDRKITLFIPLPLLLICYILNTNKYRNKLFIVALCLLFLGLMYFNNPFQKISSWGLIFTGLAFLVYFLIFYNQLNIVSIKKVFLFGLLILFIVGIPLFIYSDGINKRQMLGAAAFYVFSVTLFLFCALVVFFKTKNNNKWILAAVLSVILNTYFQGYNMFNSRIVGLEFLAVIFFNLTHYFIACYLIENKNKSYVLENNFKN